MRQDLSAERFLDGHPAADELSAFARGDALTSERMEAIEAHLHECEACQHVVSDVTPDQFMQAVWQYGRDQRTSDVRMVEGYQLLEQLGEGGAGVVYRARQPALDREVALKLLKSGIAASDVELKRWRRECRALATLNHPHIVKIFDAGEQRGTPFLAMELVEGKTLSQFLQAGPLAAKDAACLVRQLAAAIEFAHQQGVVHRDLKPGNVLLPSGTDVAATASDDGNELAPRAVWGDAKIADFGLSCWINEDGHSQTGDALGTPSYMAPEQVVGQHAKIGPHTDVYGLGAILYECLTGRPPFRGASAVETMQLVVSREPLSIARLRSQVPADLEAICLRCLEKQPARRYATAGALQEDLTAFLEGRPVTAKRPGPPRRAYLWFCRNRGAAAFLVFAILALGAGVGALLWHQKTLFDERALAHRHYSEARATIRDMLNTAQSHSSFDIPKLNEMSLRQAEQALALFERLAAEENTSQSQLELARVRMTLGTLAVTLGQLDRGAQQLQLAADTFRTLKDHEPESRALISDLVTAQIRLAVVRRGAEAVTLLNQVAPICESLVALDPTDPSSLNLMAWLHHSLGNARFKNDQLREARADYQASIDWRERALQVSPESKPTRTSLAESRLNLAQCSAQLGETVASREQFRSGIAVLDAALVDSPPDLALLTSRGVAYLNLSNVAAAIDGAAAAVKSCDEGLRSARAAYDAEPHNLVARDTLFRLLGNRGMYRMQADQAAPAVADWREAIELATDPESQEYCRTMLIRCLTVDGQYSVAEQEADAGSQTIQTPLNRFRLAAAWGNLSDATREQDPVRAARCATRCLTAVRALVTSSTAKELAELQAEFESLDDFRALRELTSIEERRSWFSGAPTSHNAPSDQSHDQHD